MTTSIISKALEIMNGETDNARSSEKFWYKENLEIRNKVIMSFEAWQTGRRAKYIIFWMLNGKGYFHKISALYL